MVKRVTKKAPERGYLDGQFLIAMPGMQDSRFSRTVVYICAHSSDGAMGIMVNQPAPQISFRDLLVQLNIIPEGPEIRLPDAAGSMRVHRGGPVETGRGFVLHSADYFIENSTLPIDEHICLTATLEILKAIALGNGPRDAMLALGYAGWAPGQLESEISGERLAQLPRYAATDLRPEPRTEIRSRACHDRHRPGAPVERSRTRLRRRPPVAFTILFALYGLAMVAALFRWPRIAESVFLLTLALSVAVFLHHATSKLAISL